VYNIRGNKVLDILRLSPNFNKPVHGSFDIMKDIPGMHIGNVASSVGDFNGDGINEVFKYAFFRYGKLLQIIGYDVGKNKSAEYCSIPFELLDPEEGPAPMEFMTYKGMDGFKVYYYDNIVWPDSPRPPNPLNGKWLFYAWDHTERQYVMIEEIEE
jgi:hypothetical protein